MEDVTQDSPQDYCSQENEYGEGRGQTAVDFTGSWIPQHREQHNQAEIYQQRGQQQIIAPGLQRMSFQKCAKGSL